MQTISQGLEGIAKMYCVDLVFAVLTCLLLLWGLLVATGRRSDPMTLDDWRRLLARLVKAMPELPLMEGDPLRRQCKVVVKDLRSATGFLLEHANRYSRDKGQDATMGRLAGTVFRQGIDLYLHLRRTSVYLGIPLQSARRKSRDLTLQAARDSARCARR